MLKFLVLLLLIPSLAVAEEMSYSYCTIFFVGKVQIVYHGLQATKSKEEIVNQIIDKYYSHRFFNERQQQAIDEAYEFTLQLQLKIPTDNSDVWIEQYLLENVCPKEEHVNKFQG